MQGDSYINKHGLFLSKTNTIDDDNFKFSTGDNNISAANGINYKAAVVVTVGNTDSEFNINLGARDTKKITNTDDIVVVVEKVDSEGNIGEIDSSAKATKVLEDDGTININVTFDSTGKYLVTYAFLMQSSNSTFTSKASIENSSQDLKFDLNDEMPDLF